MAGKIRVRPWQWWVENGGGFRRVRLRLSRAEIGCIRDGGLHGGDVYEDEMWSGMEALGETLVIWNRTLDHGGDWFGLDLQGGCEDGQLLEEDTSIEVVHFQVIFACFVKHTFFRHYPR